MTTIICTKNPDKFPNIEVFPPLETIFDPNEQALCWNDALNKTQFICWSSILIETIGLLIDEGIIDRHNIVLQMDDEEGLEPVIVMYDENGILDNNWRFGWFSPNLETFELIEGK